ncbi:MAG: hypothetical protein HZC38_04955 [Chloroflexi bacterium]|nr:hypothetical protein [Chloroflexota bacterium]MBI5051984.1 hypothetical protein [Chloroflexota bacterium]MBI5082141.1 hypothetical protein [Chloroflexota bacterium]MBI5348333.1 hypothetical protein [Chloroflexota bacterium]MBI5712760.1 hypothetical protein [Chloroflexota bacterium]
MEVQSINAERLLRQVLTSIAQLPPPDLLVVYETINDLQQKNVQGESRLTSDEILARAKQRAVEMSRMSHEEVVQQFINATDRIRAEAIVKGVAIEGE